METRTSTTSAHTITNLVVVEKTRTASYCENSRKPNVVCITVHGKIYKGYFWGNQLYTKIFIFHLAIRGAANWKLT